MYCGDTSIVLDTNLVVILVALLQSAQDRDGTQFVRLIHHHSLESTLKGLVLLEVLLILIECGCTNGSEFTTCECRLQNVGSIHSTLATTSAYQCVYLVDEQDDAALGLGHLVDHALESFLKLALVFCTSNKCSHIERVELLVLKVLRHVATNNTTSQTLNDGCLTSTWFTY